MDQVWRHSYTTTTSTGLSSILVSYDSEITVTQEAAPGGASQSADDGPLITYVYSESPEARREHPSS